MRFALLIALYFACPACAYGQDSAESLRYSDPTTSIWEMGIEIEGTGDTLGLTAVFPVPMDWPEQSIKVLEEKKSRNVSRITVGFANREKTCRIAKVFIPRLGATETARATLVIQVKKSHTLEPRDKSLLKISSRAKRTQKYFLGSSPFIETSHPRLKQVAESIQTGDGVSDWEKVEAIFRWVRSNVEYKFDETIRTCITALNTGRGDCEEMSSLFIALCRLKGIPARAVWIPGHTYPEFYLENNRGKGVWVPCQVAGGNDDFGRMPEDKPILQKGDKFKLPGHLKVQRYARPTLSARSAKSAPRLKWIIEKSEK